MGGVLQITINQLDLSSYKTEENMTGPQQQFSLHSRLWQTL